MKELEDQLLQQNAGEVKQQTEAMPEMKIYQAMRSGIYKGKQRSRRRRLTSGAGVALAAAAILLIFTFLNTPGSKAEYSSPAAAETRAWTDSVRFHDYLPKNNAVANAVNQNLIKPVYQSVQKAGIRLEILGTVSDGRQVFILYGVTNHSSETVNHADFGLQFGTVEAADIGAKLDMVGSDSRITPGQTVYFIYSNNLSPGTDYPEEVNYNVTLTQTSTEAMLSSSNKYRTNLDIQFELDTKQLNDQNKTWVAEQDMTIAGQKLSVQQVQQTPLSIYVDIEANKNNRKQIFGLINPVLIGKKGGQIIKSYYPALLTADNSELHADVNSFTLVYPGKDYATQEHFSLKVFGIAALDKDQMKVVIDLNNKQLVEAPAGLTLDHTQKRKGSGEFVLNFKMENEYAQQSGTMRLENGFTDAAGNKHSLPKEESVSLSEYLSRGSKSVEEKYFYNFGEKAKTYPQPLTITIERYWYPVMETHELELSPK